MAAELRPDEALAKRFLEKVLVTGVSQHDDGTQSGMYDLDVGDDTALEVTGLENRQARETWQAMPESGISAPVLQRSWAVMVDGDLLVQQNNKHRPMRNLRAMLPVLIGELERRGITEMSRWKDCAGGFHDGGCPIEGLERHGVQFAWPLEPDSHQSSQIELAMSGGLGLCGGANDLVEEIEVEFDNKPDLALKLRNVSRTQRHVFFWAKYNRYRALRPLQMDTVPDRTPVYLRASPACGWPPRSALLEHFSGPSRQVGNDTKWTFRTSP